MSKVVGIQKKLASSSWQQRCLLPIAICLCLLVLSAKSQNAKEDIRKINESYLKRKDLSMDIVYNVYSNYTAESPLETSMGSYKQHGNLRYNKLKGIESLQNTECLLIIDNDGKRIMIGNPVKFDPSKITLMNLDTAFSKYSSVKYIDNKSSFQKGYSIVFKPTVTSEYDKVDMFFNEKTYVVEKMIFYYRQEVQFNEEDENSKKEKPRLEIIFSKIKFENSMSMDFYSESRFIEKRNGKYYPVSAYNTYQVIDQKFIK